MSNPECSTLPVGREHHSTSTSEVERQHPPCLLPGCGDDMTGCLPFLWPELLHHGGCTMWYSGEPKASGESVLIGVSVWIFTRRGRAVCLCAFERLSGCASSQACDVCVQARLSQTHHGTYSFPVCSER